MTWNVRKHKNNNTQSSLVGVAQLVRKDSIPSQGTWLGYGLIPGPGTSTGGRQPIDVSFTLIFLSLPTSLPLSLKISMQKIYSGED